MLRTLFMIFFLASSCEDESLRSQNRPSENGDEVPGYLEETTESIEANKAVTISINNTTISIPEGGLGEDAEVRLRVLKGIPDRDQVASLGGAKGDVIELTMYNKATEEIYASTLLDQPYAASQVLGDVSEEANLKYVVISAPGTEDELVQVLSRKAISSGAALTATDLSVSIELNTTNVIFYAVESADVSPTVVVIDSGRETSNDSGGSPSEGKSIDCSNLAGGEWIPAPSNAAVGQNEDFCVMKYEAKNVEGVATSQSAEIPWNNISLSDSQIKCDALNSIDPGKDYRLITNEMWQAIARNIETARDEKDLYLNWSESNIEGNTAINLGHASLSSYCDGSIEYIGGGCHSLDQSTPHQKKRTHTLSNGEVIWDFSGNIWEWTSSSVTKKWDNDYIAQKNWNSSTGDDDLEAQLKFGPTYTYHNRGNADFPKDDGAGLGYGWLNYDWGAIIRGGFWSYSDSPGIFAVTLNNSPSKGYSNIGFRCAMSLGPQAD